MFIETTICEYLRQAEAKEEVPGGGSVAALCGALGVCMASMAAQFTTGKKKFAEVEEEIQSLLGQFAPLREELSRCVDDDPQAFAGFGTVYAMPKESDEEKKARDEAMQHTLKHAMAVPLRVMIACVDALRLMPRLAEIGNKNLISDTGVAAILADAATRAAYLNVMVNLKFIKDSDLIRDTRAEVEDLLATSATLCKKTTALVEREILG